MIKYSTSNDSPRLFREEEQDPRNLFRATEFDLNESLVLLKEMLDRLHADPAEKCVRKVLEYSRSLGTQ